MNRDETTGVAPVAGQLPYFTLGEACKQAKVSKPTLSKAIKNGRLSAEKQPDGSYRIQPAELFRVFPPETPPNGLSRNEFDGRETGNETQLARDQIAELRQRLALLTGERERERQQLTDQIMDLRRRLDSEAEERRRLTLIVTDQRPRRGFWRRAFKCAQS
jgi:excisionase family DNA binding protein